MKYKNLDKGQIYSIFYKKRVIRGSYKCRYFNKEMNQWYYVFKSLDKFTTYCLPSIETETRTLIL